MEAVLQKELDVLEAKVRFIIDFIEGRVELRNKKKAEIFAQFKQLNYPKFDLVSKKGEAGYKRSYDYLIRMQLYSLTKEKVDELVALRDAKRLELDALIQKTPINLWEEDLAEFEKVYYKVYPASKKSKKAKISPKGRWGFSGQLMTR